MPRPSLRLLRLSTSRARRKRLATMFLALLTLLAFLTPFYVIYKPPHTLIAYFQRRWPDVLWHVPDVRDKVIALTIDDAPSEYTREILDVLRENGARATFFVIGGQVAGREDVLRDVVAGGMELGNHAMHDEPARGLSAGTLAAELGEVDGLIRAAYAAEGVEQSQQQRYYRPGSGFFSTRMREQVSALGYRMVLGSVYPHDAQIGYSGMNARHVLSMVRPGSVVVCHDRRAWTAGMLRVVLPELKRRGYRVVTVSGLLEAGRGG